MNQQHYLKNIDWIRAIASILVVALHYNITLDSSKIVAPEVQACLRYYVMRLAVPLFFIVSLFLFSRKIRDFSYVKQRLQQLLLIGFIWSFIFFICSGGLNGCVKVFMSIAKKITSSPNLFFYYFFSNIETVYYFFTSLSIVLFITFYLQNKSNKLIFIFLICSVLTIGILPLIFPNLAVVYNPMNFVSYAPTSILMNRFFPSLIKQRLKVSLILLLIGALFTFWEIKISSTGVFLLDGYTRNSLVFLSAGIFLMSFFIQSTNKVIEFMSEQSLSLYLLHFCLFPLVGTIDNIMFIKILHFPSEYADFCSLFVVVGICYLISKFLMPRFFVTTVYRVR